MDRPVTDRGEIERILADPSFEVAPATPGRSGLPWLRGSVSRFVNGEPHARRRALVVAELDRLDVAALRTDARARTQALIDRADSGPDVMGRFARPVPLAALCAALGIDDAELDRAVADAVLVGRCYLTGEPEGDVDAAVARLAERLGRSGNEASAAALAVLAQACEATATLIANALALVAQEPGLAHDTDHLLDETLRRSPPLKVMRRVSPGGATMILDLDVASRAIAPGEPPLTFGSGVRPCPAQAHARALAGGVLDVLTST